MLLLVLLASATAAPASPPVQAQASVRIVAPARATREEWSRQPKERQREIKIREADGRTTRVRLIEHQ